MDDVQSEISKLRREFRALEDDVTGLRRTKASNDDFAAVATKQAEMESDLLGRYRSLQNELHEMHEQMKRIGSALESIADDLNKHKRKTSADLDELVLPNVTKRRDRDDRPVLPVRVLLGLFLLAGVGLAVIIEKAPGMAMNFGGF